MHVALVEIDWSWMAVMVMVSEICVTSSSLHLDSIVKQLGVKIVYANLGSCVVMHVWGCW